MGGLRGGDGMKVEKKQFQCQESMHPFEFSYQKEGITCIRVDVARGRGKMDFAKMFKKYWGKKKKPLEFKVPCYAIFTLQMFSNYIIRLQPVSEIAQKSPSCTTFPCSTFQRV